MKLIVQPEAGVSPIIHAIRLARKEIDIAIFRLDRKEVEQALAAAVQRGVRVRALIAHTNRGGEARLRKLEQRLLAAGVMVTRTGDDLLRYHGKFMIADEVLHLFGFNFTKLDIDKSRSFAIATRDRRSVKDAQALFEADSTRQTYAPSRSNLVVSPETARDQLSAFIKGARRELSIYDLKIQDRGMIKLLEDRVKKGVAIRVIGGAKRLGENIEVRKPKIRLHVRAIIRDGTRAFVGSQSLRTDELQNRREVGLLVSNPSVTRKIMQVFEADWSEAGPKKGEEVEAKESAAEKKASDSKGADEEKESRKDEPKKASA